MKRKWLIPVVVVLVLALVLVGMGTLRRRSAQSLAQYATATVSRGSLEVTVTNTGTLVSGAQQDVRPTITATVDAVLAKVGDQVKQGQVLARLSNPDLITTLNQARASYNAEQARLADMRSPQSKATQNDIKNAQFRVTQAEYTLAQRQADVDGLVVTSPVSGVVGSLPVGTGDQPAAQTSLATVVDMSTLAFSGSVSQVAAGSVHVGDAGTFVVSGNGVSLRGKVTSVSPVGSGTGSNITYPITVAIIDSVTGLDVRPGMYGVYTLDSGIKVNGNLSARTYTLRSRTAATVNSVSVSVGDSVAAGQTLITMTSDAAVQALQQAQIDLDNARVSLANLQSPPVTATSTDIASEEAKVAQTLASYENAQADVDELTVRAPFDGVVTACNLDVGGRIATNASQAAFVVADFSRMSVNISVDELDVAKLKVGMAAAVDVQAKPDKTYEATISSISPQGTVSQGVATYPVELQLVDPAGLLAGMTANVTIICDSRSDVLYVPIEAVQKVRDRSVVRTLGADRKVTSVEVQTGLANDMDIEIVSGLSEGETVITGTVNNSSGMRFPGMGNLGGGRATQTTPGGGR